MKLEIVCIVLALTQIYAELQSGCRDRGSRMVCLQACGWKSVPGRRCPRGKQCCLLKPRHSLYHTVKGNQITTEHEENVLPEEIWKPLASEGNAPVFTWFIPRRNAIKHPWSNQADMTPLKVILPISKFPWSTSSETDNANVRPNHPYNDIEASFDVSTEDPFVASFEASNDISSSSKDAKILMSNHKVILNPAKYIKPKMSPVKKSVLPLRKSAKYCEKYSKIAKRSVQAMPLLPYVYTYTMDVDDCGPSFTPLIVGGKPVDQGEFPHMAALGYKRGGDIDYLCGGSLISEKYVLTAAHCSKTRWGPPVQVHLGSSELYSENATTVEVNSVVVHPGYAAPACYHDIALVKLEESPVLSLELRPACLPAVKSQAQVPGAITLATGWGKLGFGRESSMNLMKVSLKVIDNNKCKEFYWRDSETPSLLQGITPSMLCATGHKAKFHDTCQGDSGGPLQALKEGSKCMMEIVGITSFGKSCGTGIPAVYTRVATYLDWIESIVWP